MLREFARKIRHERLNARDLVERKQNPVLIGRHDADRPFQNRRVVRVEDVVEIAIHELDAKGLERLGFDEDLKFLPQHAAPPQSRTLPQFEYVDPLDLVEPNPAEMLFWRPHNEFTR
jgi:hypothetical protein